MLLRSSAPAALASSKSFRVVLRLSGEERDRIDRYCQANFAVHALFRDDPGDAHVIWLATRDKARRSAALGADILRHNSLVAWEMSGRSIAR